MNDVTRVLKMDKYTLQSLVGLFHTHHAFYKVSYLSIYLFI